VLLLTTAALPFVAVPAEQFPVTVTIPVEEFMTAAEFPIPVPPVQFPDIFMIPLLLFRTAVLM
jgi:hypothetical protein